MPMQARKSSEEETLLAKVLPQRGVNRLRRHKNNAYSCTQCSATEEGEGFTCTASGTAAERSPADRRQAEEAADMLNAPPASTTHLKRCSLYLMPPTKKQVPARYMNAQHMHP